MGSVAVMLFATCEGASTRQRAVGLVGVGAFLLVAIAIATLVLRPRGERARLVATYLVTAVIGAVVATTPGGLSDDNANYLARFFVGVAIGTAIGLAMAAVRRRRLVSYATAGLMGGATFLAGGVALLVGALAITGGCFD